MTAIARFHDQFAQPKSRQRKAKPLAQIEVALDDAKRRAATGEWAWSKGSTLVGLYALCHQMIYGLIPEELYVAGNFRIATRLAAKFMHESFDDDGAAVAELIRWSWEREKRKNDWALANGIDRNRLSWRFQFSRALLTDFRIAMTRRRR